MDSQPKLPDIKPEVNKEKEEERRGGIAGWLSKLGVGGTGAGGLGGAAGEAGLLGGLLATKAGLIGLIVVGSSVAGGLGLLGYKLFGPGSGDQADSNFSSIFEARPPKAPGAEEGDAGAKDGNSSSLNYLAQANTAGAGDKTKADASAADKAKADAAAAEKAKADAAAKAGAAGAGAKTAAAAAAKAPAKLGSSLGGLGKFGGGGGGAAGAGPALASAHSTGVSGGMGGAKPSLGKGLQGLAGNRKLGALGQLKQVGAQQKGATSSYGSGATYDGHGASIDGGGQALGGAPTGAGGAGGAPSAPGTADDSGRFTPPPPSAPPTNVTPWQAAINLAALCIAGAALLLFMAAKLAKSAGPAAAYVCAALAAALGVYAIYLGARIGGGEYGQHLQGEMITIAGSAIVATSLMACFSVGGSGPPPTGMCADGNPSALMMVCGAAALGSLAYGYLSPPLSFPPSTFPDGYPPDYDHQSGNEGGGGLFGPIGPSGPPSTTTTPPHSSRGKLRRRGRGGAPSDDVLKEFLA